ncbi:MAG: AAA domain-containing protein [Actinomycetota bacterium]
MTGSPTSSPSERRDRIRSALVEWAGELAALGGRNSLLWYHDLPAGTLDLTSAHPSGLAMMLAGRTTRLSTLIREPDALGDARRRARTIRGKSAELADERGLSGCWLAVGMSTWDRADGGRPPAAPVLLRGCTLRQVGGHAEDISIDLSPTVHLNPIMVRYFADEFGIQLDLRRVTELAVSAEGFDPSPVLDEVRQACRAVPGFTVLNRLLISTFSAVRLALVDDLEASSDALPDHDVIAALAGDSTPAPPVPSVSSEGDPAGELFVLDLDGDQQAAVQAVLSDHSFVLEAPPGSGKTQTVTAALAASAASGHRNLVVAQQQASLHAVMDRLASVGLSDLAVHLPGDDVTVRDVASQVLAVVDADPQSQEAPQSAPFTEHAASLKHVASQVVVSRGVLTDHVRSLHRTYQPWHVSAYDAQEALARLTALRPAPRSRIRLAGASLMMLDQSAMRQWGERLVDACKLGAFRIAPSDDPWAGVRLSSAAEADRALATASDLVDDDLPQLRQIISDVLEAANMPQPRCVADMRAALDLLVSVRDTLEIFSAEVHHVSLQDAIAATASAQWRAERKITWSSWQRLRLVRSARALLRPGVPPDDLHNALVAADRQRRQWQALAQPGARPCVPPGMAEAERALAVVLEGLDHLSGWLPETAPETLQTLELDALAARLSRMTNRTPALEITPQIAGLVTDATSAGLQEVLGDLAERRIPEAEVISEWELIWWTSVLEHIVAEDRRYGAHDGQRLRAAAAEFDRTNQACQQAHATVIRRAVISRARSAALRHPAQLARLRAVAAGVDGVQTVYELIADCPEVIHAAIPWWFMSPLVVPSVFGAAPAFDGVFLLEASTVSPAIAVAALRRGRQVVVVGDDQQAPPVGFFSHAVPERQEQMIPRSTGPSVIAVLSAALPIVRLKRDYRSADDRLMSFVRTTRYPDTQIPPNRGGSSPVLWEQVDGRGVLAPDADTVDSTDAEVARVVELVLQRLRRYPEQSMGVVTLTWRHARRIEDSLRLSMAENPVLAEASGWDDPDSPQRLFVKPVDRVHGEKRDAIVFSIGYGRTPHGRVLHRFGLVSDPDGPRWLTVAMTRARCSLTVVSAFAATDLDPHRLNGAGPRMLRDYLAHLAVEPLTVRDPAVKTDPAVTSEVVEKNGLVAEGEMQGAGLIGSTDQGALLADMRDRLRSAGYRVAVDYGSSLRADLVVGRAVGPWVVAVGIDGPRYAEAAHARERNRLPGVWWGRAGWSYLHVWSTDIFHDPAREVARVIQAVEAVPVSITETDDNDTTRSKDAGKKDESTTDTGTQNGGMTATELSQREVGWWSSGSSNAQSNALTDHDQWLVEQRPPHWS